MATPSKPARRNNTDPESTRREILQAALEVISKDGPESLSVTKVARRAGVNRGTAYQHFPTREELVHATATWVSERISKEFYGDFEELTKTHAVYPPDIAQERLVNFSMNNPELSRAWLFDVIAAEGKATDPFWRRYLEGLQDFVDRGYTRKTIDVEVYAFIALAASLLWPVWVGAHNKSPEEKEKLQQRFNDEMMRLVLFGSLDPERYAYLREKFGKAEPVTSESTISE